MAVVNWRILGSEIFFLRLIFERERESWGGAEREGERERVSSRPRAVSTEPDAGLELTNCEIVT